MWPKNALNISRPNISNMCVCHGGCHLNVWVLFWLVAYLPLWKIWVSWDDYSIPNHIWKVMKIPWFQSPPTRNISKFPRSMAKNMWNPCWCHGHLSDNENPLPAWPSLGPSSFDELILSWMASILGNLQARLFFYHQILYSFPLSNFPPQKKWDLIHVFSPPIIELDDGKN